MSETPRHRAPQDFSTTMTLSLLERRSQLLRDIRRFFYEQNFWEVETPVLSQETVIDLYLEPIQVQLPAPHAQTRYLQTSPEFGMKRLLASGARSIFQITRAFRLGEIGQRHNPEFTMLEWYRCGDNYEAGRQLLAQFIESLLDEACQQITFREAMLQFADLDPFFASNQDLSEQAEQLGFVSPLPELEDEPFQLQRRDTIHFLWAELVEPHLGTRCPQIVYDWPATEAALAQTAVRQWSDGQAYHVAERFELYVAGVELANGYHELLDAGVLQERNQHTNASRRAAGKETLPENHRLLAAMQHGFPPCCGVALGVDRLAMVLFGQSELSQVISFPWERA